VFKFKNIAEVKPKYYLSIMQGPASTLQCDVLDCCSRDGLPCLLPVLRLATGSHPLATVVTILRHLCTQFNPQAKPEQLKLSKTDPSTWP
jgi:hypothetical protein